MTVTKDFSLFSTFSAASFVSLGAAPGNAQAASVVLQAADKIAVSAENALMAVANSRISLGGVSTEGGLQGNMAGTAQNLGKELA